MDGFHQDESEDKGDEGAEVASRFIASESDSFEALELADETTASSSRALHYFSVHNITWRALPAEYGPWNSVWKRFWRLSRAGMFEAFFEALAAISRTAHLVQMFDSTVDATPQRATKARCAPAMRGFEPF